MATAHGISKGQAIIGGVLALAVALVVLALIAPLIAIRLYGGNHYQIRGDDMAPALLTGDWVLAGPIDPDAVPPRGSIVAYRYPGKGDTTMVMRIVGLPGEQVQIRGGALYIDGQRAEMERIGDRIIRKRQPARRIPLPACINDPVKLDGDCRQEQWRETLPDDTETRVLNSRGTIGLATPGAATGDDTPVFRVPDDAVFVLGDNRDAAHDSRFADHGVVPVADLLHEIWLVHSSLDKSSRFFHPRWDRFFRRVQ